MKKSMREFTFCNADQCEIMVNIKEDGTIIDIYCYADNLPWFENPETGKELKTPMIADRKNHLFVTITNKLTTLRRMVAHADYLPLIDTEDTDYVYEVDILAKCFAKYKIEYADSIFEY